MPDPKKFKVKNLVSKMLGGKVPNSGNTDIPGTLAVGNVAKDLMGSPKPKSLVSNVAKKGMSYIQKKKKD